MLTRRRAQLTSRLGTFAVLGFILGPAFGAMFTTINFRVAALNLTVDPYTAPGIFILFVGVAMFVATSNFFLPSPVSGREMAGSSSKSSLEAMVGSSTGGEDDDDEAMSLLHANGSATAGLPSYPPPSTVAVTTLLVIFFVHFYR